MTDPYGQPEAEYSAIPMPEPPADGQPYPVAEPPGGEMMPAEQAQVPGMPAVGRTAVLFLVTGAVGALAGYYLKSTWDRMHSD